MPQTLKVTISTADTDLEFTILSTTTGKELFDKVSRSIGLREAWFFGLSYFDESNQVCWMDLAKKVASHKIKKEVPLKMQFKAKYFPEDAAEELILPLTKQLFFLQVRNSVLNEEYYCPAETAVLLASYALQAKFGEYDPAVQNLEFFQKEKLVPEKIIRQHSLTKAEWDQKVINWYVEHKYMEKEVAMVEYLKVAQDLDVYGITYFDITNKKKSKLSLGVDALGINVYDREDKLTPKIGFPWAEVSKVSYSGKKFIVKTTDANSTNFVFLASKTNINKKIIGLSNGNYSLYSRRRKADSIEVQQMKAQVKEDKDSKDNQIFLLFKEREHRATVESQNIELEGQVEDYRRKMEISKEDLETSHRSSEGLRQKLEELELKRQELEESQSRAYEAKRIAEEAVNSEKAERMIKEQQAAEAQEMLELKMEEAKEKEEEARGLQDELLKARNEIESQQYHSVDRRASEMTSCIDTRNFTRETSDVTNNGFDFDHEINQLDDAIKEGSSSFVSEKEADYEIAEYQHNYDKTQIEPERMTTTEKNMKLENKLKTLQRELEVSRSANEMTKDDHIYVKNVKQGRDKYKTLKQIRQGNTKIRIETFESL